jgi:hypothetical protein
MVFCLIVAGLGISAWGQNIGVGGYLNATMAGGGFEEKTTFMGRTIHALSLSNRNMGRFEGGGFVFFDTNYLKTSVGIYSNGIRQEMQVNSPLIEPEETIEINFMALSFGLMGKYTFFRDSKKARFFVQLGIDYNLVLWAELNGKQTNTPINWSHFWINAGVGFDLLTRTPLFFRLEHLLGLKLPSKAEMDFAENARQKWGKFFYEEYGTSQSFTSRTFPGFSLIPIRLSVGYSL